MSDDSPPTTMNTHRIRYQREYLSLHVRIGRKRVYWSRVRRMYVLRMESAIRTTVRRWIRRQYRDSDRMTGMVMGQPMLSLDGWWEDKPCIVVGVPVFMEVLPEHVWSMQQVVDDPKFADFSIIELVHGETDEVQPSA